MENHIPDPFLRDESGLKWLADALDEHNGVSTKVMYGLEILSRKIINHNKNGENQQVYRRLPDGAIIGLADGGKRNVSLQCILRGSLQAAGGNRQGNAQATQERALRFAKEWAQTAGVWFEDPDSQIISAGYKKLSEGGEARVYIPDEGDVNYVLKVINAPGWTSLGYLADRISLHNYVFPETTLRVVGWGENPEGYLCAVVKQPFIKGKATGQREVAMTVTDAGFHMIDGVRVPFLFFTENLCLGDLHEGNVLTSPEGELMVIDCDIAMNTPEMGYGGEWVIPDLTYDDETVKKIDAAVSSILPSIVSSEKLFADNPEIRETLQRSGHSDGFVNIKLDGHATDAIVQVCSKNTDIVLVMPAERLEDYTELLDNPEVFDYIRNSNSSDFAFDLESGKLKEKSLFKKAKILFKNNVPSDEHKEGIKR